MAWGGLAKPSRDFEPQYGANVAMLVARLVCNLLYKAHLQNRWFNITIRG